MRDGGRSDRHAEANSEHQFQPGVTRQSTAIPTRGGGLPHSEVVLRCAQKGRSLTAYPFPDRPGVIQTETDTDTHQCGQAAERVADVTGGDFLGDQVEAEDRERGEGEQRQVNQYDLARIDLCAQKDRGYHEEHQAQHGEVGQVRGHMEGRFEFHVEGQIGFPDFRQKFPGGLDRALGPAMLLRFEGTHFDRQFGGSDDVRQINEAPALHLGPVGQIQIFRQRIVLPAAGIVDACATPDSCRTVEIEEATGEVARTVFNDEMSIQKNRLHPCQQGMVSVQMSPAGLHHTDPVLGECR